MMADYSNQMVRTVYRIHDSAGTVERCASTDRAREFKEMGYCIETIVEVDGEDEIVKDGFWPHEAQKHIDV